MMLVDDHGSLLTMVVAVNIVIVGDEQSLLWVIPLHPNHCFLLLLFQHIPNTLFRGKFRIFDGYTSIFH